MRFASLGSAVAWYTGDDPDIQALQANFHEIRYHLYPRTPYEYGCVRALFEAMKPYYKDKDLLMWQLEKANKAWELQEMNKGLTSKPATQRTAHRIDMRDVAYENKQLTLALHRWKPTAVANQRVRRARQTAPDP